MLYGHFQFAMNVVHNCSHNCMKAIILLTTASMPTRNYSKLIHPWAVAALLIKRATSWVLEQWLLITITVLTELEGARARGDAMRIGISRAN
jgi:hypothetical protein